MIKIDIQKELNAASGTLLLDLNLTIDEGEFVTLYGPSGAGKTSTLRMLSGLLDPKSGSIVVNQESWFDDAKKVNLSPQRRSIGMVFQDFALFPNMSVIDNLNFALPKNQDNKIINKIIEVVELSGLKERMPNTLSGGQQQRVALARALVQHPKILLLDEPLSALDLQLRLKLQDYIAEAHKAFNLTTILISHDIAEIMKLSDKVFMLDQGKLVNEGSPEDVFVNNKEISGKFKFVGEVLKVDKQDVVNIVTVIIQNNIVKIVAQDEEITDIRIGDKVMVASKAFNPIIYKL